MLLLLLMLMLGGRLSILLLLSVSVRRRRAGGAVVGRRGVDDGRILESRGELGLGELSLVDRVPLSMLSLLLSLGRPRRDDADVGDAGATDTEVRDVLVRGQKVH